MADIGADRRAVSPGGRVFPARNRAQCRARRADVVARPRVVVLGRRRRAPRPADLGIEAVAREQGVRPLATPAGSATRARSGHSGRGVAPRPPGPASIVAPSSAGIPATPRGARRRTRSTVARSTPLSASSWRMARSPRGRPGRATRPRPGRRPRRRGRRDRAGGRSRPRRARSGSRRRSAAAGPRRPSGPAARGTARPPRGRPPDRRWPPCVPAAPRRVVVAARPGPTLRTAS